MVYILTIIEMLSHSVMFSIHPYIYSPIYMYVYSPSLMFVYMESQPLNLYSQLADLRINIHSLYTCILSLHAATSPPTIASIREETVQSVNITLGEPAEGSECVEDYIIQYRNETVYTNRTLSVVIDDVVFCQYPNITFNATAVLRDGSLISESESNFTLAGESKYR